MNPQELKHTLSSGLLTFPVTDFDAAGNFRPATYAQRLDWLTAYRPRVLFAAGALGEFFSLTPQEFVDVIRTAVDTAAIKRYPDTEGIISITLNPAQGSPLK